MEIKKKILVQVDDIENSSKVFNNENNSFHAVSIKHVFKKTALSKVCGWNFKSSPHLP